MKKFFIFILIFNLSIQFSYSMDMIDNTVDLKIKSSNDINKISRDSLPPLPNIEINSLENVESVKTFYQPRVSSTIYKGTKIRAKLLTGLNDRTAEGAVFSAKTLNEVMTSNMALPVGTLLKGRVVRSHPSWLGGDGGLLVLKIDKIIINANAFNFDSKITSLNRKIVFFEKIKGKNTYFRSVGNSISPGKSVYSKMWGYTKELASDSPQFILSPITFFTGTLFLGANILVSPVLGIFSKGNNLVIPSGSEIIIKLNENTSLNF